MDMSWPRCPVDMAASRVGFSWSRFEEATSDRLMSLFAGLQNVMSLDEFTFPEYERLV